LHVGQSPVWGGAVGPNATDRGKNGSKKSLLTEGDGGPLGIVVAAANVNDDRLLLQTIEAMVVERPRVKQKRSQHLSLDQGCSVLTT
jgi:hypothetical protein